MPDYQQGKIYKIVCNVSGDVYYGSTTNIRLCDRIAGHKNDYKRHLNGLGKKTVSSFKILEGKNYYYALVELFPCNSKDELHARERHWIEKNECVNKSIPTRTKQEYSKVFYENHKEELTLKHKEYRIKNVEKSRQYYLNNREKLLQYEKANKDRKNELKKNIYDANRDEINRKQREKYKMKKEAST